MYKLDVAERPFDRMKVDARKEFKEKQLDEELLKAAQGCIDNAFGDPVCTLFVGGRAVGLSRKNSDADLLVLLNNDEVPSLPFKFPTSAGMCEVEYHSVDKLSRRLAGFQDLLLQITEDPSAYGDAKFLAETASRILTGKQISGELKKNSVEQFSDNNLRNICDSWVAFKLSFIENVFRMRSVFKNEFHEVWTPYEFETICFERRCRKVQGYLLFECQEYYISGRYKWLVELSRRYDKSDLCDYLLSDDSFDAGKIDSANEKHISGLIRLKLDDLIVSESFLLSPTAGSKLIKHNDGSFLIASVDGRIAKFSKHSAHLFKDINLDAIDSNDARDIFTLIKKGLVCLTPKLHFR